MYGIRQNCRIDDFCKFLCWTVAGRLLASPVVASRFAIKYPSTMNRRTILKSIVAAPAVAALQAQTPAKDPARAVEDSPKVETTVADASADPVARFFTGDQFAALTRLSEIFEPSDPQTPGAREA